jgi:hypothetical protein
VFSSALQDAVICSPLSMLPVVDDAAGRTFCVAWPHVGRAASDVFLFEGDRLRTHTAYRRTIRDRTYGMDSCIAVIYRCDLEIGGAALDTALHIGRKGRAIQAFVAQSASQGSD